MKTFTMLIIIQVFTLCNMSYAQKTSKQKEKAFINWFFQKAETRPYVTPYAKDSITVYASGLSANRIDYIKKELSIDTLIDLECKKNKVILSKEEKVYIYRQLDGMKTQVWQKNLIENSILINKDTISTIFKRPVSAQLNFFSKYPHGYSFFSKPIFIRDNTLCIFYCGYNCFDLCFDDKLLILRKEGEDWVELISLIDTIV
ncbi:MAG: hypothetical protein ACKOW2_02045 [Sphingobacteriaceae bacterium]